MSPNEPWRNPRPTPELTELRARVPAKSYLVPLLKAWWPALLWAGLIFLASTDSFSSAHTVSLVERILRFLSPQIDDDTIEWINIVIRKCAHFTEYFIFYLLLYRGLRLGRKGWQWSWGVTALAIAGGYAILDELHQSFVPSRTASGWDSLLDSTGALVAAVLMFLILHGVRRRGNAPENAPGD